jgi:hypothetical protein
MLKPHYLRLFLSLSLFCLFLPQSLGAQITYDGPIIDRLNKWDSYPSHLFYGGKHHIWWCSRATVQGCLSTYVDGIFHVVKTGSLGAGGWTGWQEVFTHNQSPWSCNHTCDPSVIRGAFTYNSQTYTHALYWTSDNNALQPGIDNAVGVAFSNDGLTWTAHPTPVITTYNVPNGSYGAGAGGVAFDPVTGKLMHAYDDTTVNPASRLKDSTDGLSFTPTPPYATQLSVAAPGQNLAPDIVYHMQGSRWYAAVQVFDQEIRVLRSRTTNDLLGLWDVIGTFNSLVTGNARNNNPGLGKNAGGSLYVDAQGWAYVFFGTGTNQASTWKVAQGRFRP